MGVGLAGRVEVTEEKMAPSGSQVESDSVEEIGDTSFFRTAGGLPGSAIEWMSKRKRKKKSFHARLLLE